MLLGGMGPTEPHPTQPVARFLPVYVGFPAGDLADLLLRSERSLCFIFLAGNDVFGLQRCGLAVFLGASFREPLLSRRADHHRAKQSCCSCRLRPTQLHG